MLDGLRRSLARMLDMSRRRLVTLLALLGLISCRPATETAVPPLRVFSSNGVKALLQDVQPEVERGVGRPLAFEFSTAAALKRRIDAGDVPDVAVLTSALVDELSAQGTLARESRRDVARVGVGVGVRTDAPSTDIGTPEAVKALLLGARSVVFTAEGQSRATIDGAFDRLGIVPEMRAKTMLRGPGEAPGVVARGEADVVLTLVSEMVGVAGLKLLGPFPPALQHHVTFTAARSANSRDPEVADQLLQALSGAEVSARLARHGLEAVRP
jgi:molybdate transport system substrate-binding protein